MLALTSCRTSGRLVHISGPLGRKSLPTCRYFKACKKGLQTESWLVLKITTVGQRQTMRAYQRLQNAGFAAALAANDSNLGQLESEIESHLQSSHVQCQDSAWLNPQCFRGLADTSVYTA